MINNRGFRSLPVTVGEYNLEVTRTMTVYWNSYKGKRKLDSLYIKKTNMLSVSLPDGKEVLIYPTPEGLKVKKEVKDER